MIHRPVKKVNLKGGSRSWKKVADEYEKGKEREEERSH